MNNKRRKDVGNVRVNQEDPTHQPTTGTSQSPRLTITDHLLIMFLLKICRTILLIDTTVKLAVYLIGVLIASTISHYFLVPETILSDRKNPLNKYFIKLGWGWTVTFIGIYIILTTRVYCFANVAKILQHLMRLVVGTLMWYVCTSVFIQIGDTVGTCTQPQHDDKVQCLEAGKSWHGFDISGHIFLEMHCLLIISEEIKTFKDWDKLHDILEDDSLQTRRNLTDDEIHQARRDYTNLTPYIKGVVICITVILLLFELMLFISAVYRFHTLFQKVLASLVAAFCWFFSYHVLFRSGSPYPFLPVMPGHSCLQFMKFN